MPNPNKGTALGDRPADRRSILSSAAVLVGLALLGLASYLSAAFSHYTCFTLTSRYSVRYDACFLEDVWLARDIAFFSYIAVVGLVGLAAVVTSAVRGAGPSRVLLVSSLASAVVLLIPGVLRLLPG
jgi:Na+-driven multidrug efflux pump